MTYFHFAIPETPGKPLNPNNTDHFMTKARVKKKARAFPGRHHVTFDGDWPSEPTTIKWMIFWEPGRKILDPDNMLGSMKAYQDGLADLLGINDKYMTSTTEQIRDPEKEGRIICLVNT